MSRSQESPPSEVVCRAVWERLGRVIDPETGTDVVRMRLIEDVSVDAQGRVSYRFRPSSPLCPLAVPLALELQRAVAEVPGVTDQDLQVVGWVEAEELTTLLKQNLRKERQARRPWATPDSPEGRAFEA
jgi:metal-sulfur cluster biosynthetic enzyme